MSAWNVGIPNTALIPSALFGFPNPLCSFPCPFFSLVPASALQIPRKVCCDVFYPLMSYTKHWLASQLTPCLHARTL